MKIELPWESIETIVIAVLKEDVVLLEKENETIGPIPENIETIAALKKLIEYYGVKK